MSDLTLPTPVKSDPGKAGLIKRIDVHAHAWSSGYLDRLATTGAHRRLGADVTTEELQARFALMDSAGIQLQVLSATPASPHFERRADAVALARHINDEYATLVRRHPERFRAFAALPLPHVDAALEELQRALALDGMLGVAITTSILGRSIADPMFEPIYAELDRRGSVLYVHPAGCGAESPLIQQHRLTWAVGAPVEDTDMRRTITLCKCFDGPAALRHEASARLPPPLPLPDAPLPRLV